MRNSDTAVAKDVMTSPIVCVDTTDRLGDVEQRLVDAHVTGLPVVEGGRLVGIITRSDYVRIPILLKTYDEYVSSRQHENDLQQSDRTDFQGFRSNRRPTGTDRASFRKSRVHRAAQGRLRSGRPGQRWLAIRSL